MTLTRKRRALSELGPAPLLFGVAAVLAVIPALLEYGGFEHSAGSLLAVRLANFLFVGIFVLQHVIGLGLAPDRRRYLREEVADLLLLLLLGAVFVASLVVPSAKEGGPSLERFTVPAQIYLLVNLLLNLLRVFKAAASRRFHYARAFGISFLVIIAIGTLLLYLLPGALAPDRDLPFVDAVFTATSATCVTGLVTVETGREFSRFGQTIILILFQIGGIGLMTFAAFFAIALGKGMGFKDREVMRGVLNLEVLGTIVRVVVGILLVTVTIEAVATAVLYTRLGPDLAPGDRLFHSAFHAVSAFCNAGFSLYGRSLAGYVSDPVVNATVMLEIVIGGLGFGVVLDLLGRSFLGRGLLDLLGLARGGERRRLGLQTRIVLISSAVLILGGALLLYLIESDNPATLGGLRGPEKVEAALFQSVTARTAGFNTVPIGALRDASKFVLVVLMMIGASPGSTGGGIKTVTTVVLLLTVISLYRNRGRVEVGRRVLPEGTVNRAVVIVVSAIAVVVMATLVLTLVESGRHDFLSITFEVASAFGTVGLSTGITPSLAPLSKLTLCVVMLVGRIGPLSLVIALSQARPPRTYEYPEEQVMIG